MKRVVVVAVVVFATVVAAGCNTAGPRGLKSGVVAYNQAVAQTANQQMLLNLVRLRYRDTTAFLAVSSISSQYQFNANAGAGLSYVRPSGNKSYSSSFGVGYSEKPTISFAPLRGEDFVREMLSPATLDTLNLLFHSGWNLDRVWRCVVQGLNGVDNAPNASSPTPSAAPVYEQFKQVVGLLKTMQKRNQIELGASAEGNGILLRIADEAVNSAEMKEVVAVLGLQAGQTEYEIVASVLKAPKGKIGVNLRSLSGVLYFLSQGVEVPAEHEDRGLVTVTRTADGQRFDWGEVVGDLLRIRCSSDRPDDAAVSIKYRGAWFYIADTDLNSKSTFSLLTHFAALQAGGTPAAGPVLTLPVG